MEKQEINWDKDIEYVTGGGVYPARVVGVSVDNKKIVLGDLNNHTSYVGTFDNFGRINYYDDNTVFVRNKKTKYWVNVYLKETHKHFALFESGYGFASREEANKAAYGSERRVACIEVDVDGQA